VDGNRGLISFSRYAVLSVDNVNMKGNMDCGYCYWPRAAIEIPICNGFNGGCCVNTIFSAL
jgi:hypothetical protein